MNISKMLGLLKKVFSERVLVSRLFKYDYILYIGLGISIIVLWVFFLFPSLIPFDGRIKAALQEVDIHEYISLELPDAEDTSVEDAAFNVLYAIPEEKSIDDTSIDNMYIDDMK